MENEEHRRRLRLQWHDLSTLLDTEHGLLEALFQKTVISFAEKESVTDASGKDKNDSLLRIIYRKTAEQFELFLDALNDTNQRSLSNTLRSGDIVRIHISGLSPNSEKDFVLQLNRGCPPTQGALDGLDRLIQRLSDLKVEFSQLTNSVTLYACCNNVSDVNRLCVTFWSLQLQNLIIHLIGVNKEHHDVHVSIQTSESVVIEPGCTLDKNVHFEHWDRLTEFIIPDSKFLDQLLMKDILSYSHWTHVKSLTPFYKRNIEILNHLMKKSELKETMDNFIASLEATAQWYIVHLLGRQPDLSQHMNAIEELLDWKTTDNKDCLPCVRLIEKNVHLLVFAESVALSDDCLSSWWSRYNPQLKIDGMIHVHRWQPWRQHNLAPELMMFYLLALSSAIRRRDQREVERMIFAFTHKDEDDLRLAADKLSGLDGRHIRSVIRANLKLCTDRYPGIGYYKTSTESKSFVTIPLTSLSDQTGHLRHRLTAQGDLRAWCPTGVPLPAAASCSTEHLRQAEFQVLKKWLMSVVNEFTEVAVLPSDVGMWKDIEKDCSLAEWIGKDMLKYSSEISKNDGILHTLMVFVCNKDPLVSYAEYVRRCVSLLVSNTRLRCRSPTARIYVVVDVGTEVGLNGPDDVMKYCPQNTVHFACCGLDSTSGAVSCAVICIEV